MKPKAKINAKKTELEITLPCDPNNWYEVNKHVFNEMVRVIGELSMVKILLDESSKRYEDRISERFTQGRALFIENADQLKESIIQMMVIANRCQELFDKPDATPYDRFP